jgi:hypothetical protein
MMTTLGLFDAYDTGTVQDSLNSASQAFPDLKSAMDYIRSRWTDFVGLGAKISQQQRQASAVAVRAAQLGRPDIQKQMQDQITYLGQLSVMQGSTVDEMGTLQQAFSELGLDVNGNPSGGGAIPDAAFGLGQVPINGWTLVAALGVAVLIAGTIGYVTYRSSGSFQQIATTSKALDLVAAGKATMQQAIDVATRTAPPATPGVFQSLQGITGYLALGALAIFVLPDVVKSFSKGRR